MTTETNKYEDAFNAAPAGGNDDITGKQDLEIVDVVMANTKADNPMLKWHFRVQGGEFDGRHAWKNQNAVSPENWGYLKRDFKTCHVKIDKAADLNITSTGNNGEPGWNKTQPPVLAQFAGMKVAATFKKRGDNVDIYLDRLLESAPAKAAENTEKKGPSGVDPIPF